MKKTKMTLILISLLFLATHAHAQGGAMGGGGGQNISGRFVKYAQFAIKAMRDPSEKIFTQMDATSIESVIQATQVFNEQNDYFCTSYQDVLTGTMTKHCEDAHYYSDLKTIKVNQDTWPKLSCMDKMQSVLHEYGRASGLENANYSFSSKVHLSQSFKNWCAYIAEEEKKERQIEQTTVQNGCENNCSENVNSLMNIVNSKCFKYLREIPNPAITSEQQIKKAELIIGFESCMRQTAESWRFGIGKDCSRQFTQNECSNRCKSEGFFDFCLIPCSKF